MLGIILSGIVLVSAPVIYKYYKKFRPQNTPPIPASDDVIVKDISFNEILNVSYNNKSEYKQEENIISLYSATNFLGNKKELPTGVYDRSNIEFIINSIKFITKGHILFYKDDLRIRAYTTDISNTLEFIKSKNGWTSLQVCKL
jgi:hypothetical protein